MKGKSTLDVLYEMHKLICIAKDEGAGEFFDMHNWRLEGRFLDYWPLRLTPCKYKGLHDCGTHGCFLGWIVYYAEKTNSFLSPKRFKDCWHGQGEEKWFVFLDYYLEISDVFKEYVEESSILIGCYSHRTRLMVADYLFSQNWADRKKTNTIDHAIERLENIIACVEGGEITV